ncbi:ADP-ribosylglycohydrolase family protein [Chloroflexota bacterium]
MLGAIAGDIIGSRYEIFNTKSKDFDLFPQGCRFTDDTVLTVAVADCILNGKDYQEAFYEYGNRYPDAGYGHSFIEWLKSIDPQPYGSFGNGSAMRVSPIGFAFPDWETVLHEAERSAAVTHNHPEGIKGAQAVAAAVWMAKNSYNRDAIRDYIEKTFNYNLHRALDEIRPFYQPSISCQGSVPEAIIAFLESRDYEDAVRNAVSLGGDSDTMACIAGGIAQAYYEVVTQEIIDKVRSMLDADLLTIVDEFDNRYGL